MKEITPLQVLIALGRKLEELSALEDVGGLEYLAANDKELQPLLRTALTAFKAIETRGAVTPASPSELDSDEYRSQLISAIERLTTD